MASTRRRKLFKAARLLAYNLIILLIVDYALYARWRRPLRNRGNLPLQQLSRDSGLPLETLHAVGNFVTDYSKRDLRGVAAEHPRTIRIAAFGDSFTLGDEVAAPLDFPARLRARLAAGRTDVEVLNFGNYAHGLAQAHRLFDQAGRGYHPDYVLLGPETMYIERELTFAHAIEYDPAFIHGRYVLDGDGLRFLAPLGALDVEDRFDQYFRFVPRWQYLRYDRNTPSLLQGFLPRGRQVANPFYYSSLTPEAERDLVYTRLLDLWSRGDHQVILLHRDPAIAALSRPFHDRMVGAAFSAPYRFPYLRPRAHLSGVGNQLIADAFLAVLSGQPRIALDVVTVDPAAETAPTAGAALDLSQVRRLDVHIGGQLAATLVYEHSRFQPTFDERLLDPKADAVRGLLALQASGRPLADCPLLALDFPVTPGTELVLARRDGQRVVLGKVAAAAPGVPIAVVRVTDVWQTLTPAPISQSLDPARDAPGQLLLGEHVLYDVAPGGDGRLALKPTAGQLAYFMPLKDTLLDVATLPAQGTVHLVIHAAQPLTLPLGTFHRDTKQTEYPKNGLRKPLPAARAH
jgi:hypothetical protein